MVHPVADQLEEHLIGLPERACLDEARRQFEERGIVRVSFLAPTAIKELLALEVEELVTSHARRHTLAFPETGNTMRCMRNVRHDQIKDFGSIIPRYTQHRPCGPCCVDATGPPHALSRSALDTSAAIACPVPGGQPIGAVPGDHRRLWANATRIAPGAPAG